ncbi:glycosyltransferase family 8 protein [Gymnopilus junonius]|uniref:Glycosyltransferase family 8 protein n=1 Tax=Gymnopilus junonius TaxID=109634 RepID=A0A9P5NNX5_GYMJU|nr:glycosyltransferase family 8 protein [Gymnopilus junonius]
MSTSNEVTSYQFTPTQDWFSHNIESWTALFPLVKSDHPRVLEIGSWEGRSAIFLLNNLCKDGSEIVCIDHFDLLGTEAGRQRLSRVQHNLALTGKHARVLAQFSVPALMELLKEEMSAKDPGFDWIYVDGSHEADDTLLDGELVWRLARKGAIIIFDDYHWDKEPEDSVHHPKRGIDTFLILHAGEYERLTDDKHYQVVLKKLTDMRIGFLVGPANDQSLNVALEYGINVVLTIDSSYAIGAAVTIRSLVENMSERITIYIADCGLHTDDRAKLKETIKDYGKVTLVFLQLPEDSLARKMGPTWAKLDVIELLPIERVLYLDADVLVRKSLKPLWDVDLGEKCIGAARDIGHPMGHEKMERRPYFNAGVLLIDLAKARFEVDRLKKLGMEMKNAKFRDQDALNMIFADNWVSLDLNWNAQGLGTYANYPSDDRKSLAMEQMNDPSIVHFTGPVYPSMAEVLNPYVQPPTAKPWGYLGSPGHPYQGEWWDTLERTSWKGTRSSASWREKIKDEVEKAIDMASRKLREVTLTEA